MTQQGSSIDLNLNANLDVSNLSRQLGGVFKGLPSQLGGLFGAAGGAIGSGAGAMACAGGSVMATLPSVLSKAFGPAGIITAIGTGSCAVVSLFTKWLASSQTFQTMAGSTFKILSAMADMFLMPFIPL